MVQLLLQEAKEGFIVNHKKERIGNMSEQAEKLMELIKKWVVNDYFTPNIKAEVILDTLLSQYIEELVDGARFVTKEMSIPVENSFGNNGPKIDYVLASPDKVYLVELKTTGSSINDEQINRYLDGCQGELFGEKLGRQLLNILDNKKRTFILRLDKISLWGDETLEKIFNEIINKPKFQNDAKGESCAEKARILIQKHNWAQSKQYRSRKYLYTLGQLVDYLHNFRNEGGLWKKKVEVIYLTPGGENITNGEKAISNKSLKEFVSGLLERHSEDVYVQLLSDIIKEIYGED